MTDIKIGDRTLRELLLAIATGAPVKLVDWHGRPVRVHTGNAMVEVEEGRWERVKVEVEARLGDQPGLWEELQTTIGRLHRMGTPAGTGARPAESAVPYHKKASEVAHRLGNTVTTWARAMAEEHDHLTLTATTVPDAARWLATFPSLLAEHPAHAEMYSGILQVVKAAERVIDRAPDRVYAGPCCEPATEEAELALAENPAADVERCPGQLYVRVGDDGELQRTHVKCRDCGTDHDVLERRVWLSEQLGPMLVTAAEAAPILSWQLGKEIQVDTIHKWRLRGRLEARGELGGRPLYRFSEVEALAIEVKTRASKQRNKEGSAA